MTAVAGISAVVRGSVLQFATEAELQERLAESFAVAGVDVTREVRLTSADRIDFMACRVGIEVKVAGSTSAVLRQLRRYARTGAVDHLVLITTKAAHMIELPTVVDGIPLEVVRLPWM